MMQSEKLPLVSVITVSLNSANSISNALLSVQNQTYPKIQHIVKDGESSDETEKIILSHDSNKIAFYKSKDEGIYDALNQAIEYSNGKYIIFLHSDDVFKSKHTIARLISFIIEKKADGAYGDIKFIDESNKLVREWNSSKFKKWKLNFGWVPPHTSLILKSSIFKKIGNFDTSFKISGDYDHMIRLFLSNRFNILYHEEVVSIMKIGGASTGGLKSQLKKIQEDYKVIRKNKLLGIFTLIFKRLGKLKQLIVIKK